MPGRDAGLELVLAERRRDALRSSSSLSCTGSAPYCSTVARSLASPSLKFPEIWTSPPEAVGSGTPGADCTTPSSTIATAFCGGCFGNDSCASLLNAVAPSSFSDRSTTQPCCRRWNSRLRAADALPGERGRAELVADRRLVAGLARRAGSTVASGLVLGRRRGLDLRIRRGRGRGGARRGRAGRGRGGRRRLRGRGGRRRRLRRQRSRAPAGSAARRSCRRGAAPCRGPSRRAGR